MLISIYGCAEKSSGPIGAEEIQNIVKEKPVSEVIDEIHDIDTETSVLYNNFDSDYTKFYDSLDYASTLEELNTIQRYADRSKESAKKATERFNILLDEINEIKKRELVGNQKRYIEKLEHATISYNQLIGADLKLIDAFLKLAAYQTHNTLFIEGYKDIVRSLIRLPEFDKDKNWKALNEELQSMDNELKSAKEEVKLMKEQIFFGFLNKYDEFVSLMQEHVDKTKVVVGKKEKGITVSQSEINEADNPGINALKIFESDQSGAIYVEGESEEVEAYSTKNIYPLGDTADEFFNSADTYYSDAKLIYEQLPKGETTTAQTP